MSYFYKLDTVNKIYYYNDVNPNDGDTWTEYAGGLGTNYDYAIGAYDGSNSVGLAGYTATPYRNGLAINLGAASNLVYGGSSTKNFGGDLSGFVVSPEFKITDFCSTSSSSSNYNSFKKLPVNVGLIETIRTHFTSLEEDIELKTTKIFQSYTTRNITGGKYLEKISGNCGNSDFSEFVNLKVLTLNDEYNNDTITLNNKLLTYFSINSNNNLTTININNAAYGVNFDADMCKYLNKINVGDNVVFNTLRCVRTAIENISVKLMGTDYNSCFSGCVRLKTIDLLFIISNTITSGSIDVNNMFGGCTNLTTINCNLPDTYYIKNPSSSQPFNECTKLVGGKGTVYNTSYATMFKNDNSTPGYLSYTNDKLYEHKVYSRTDYYYCIYDRFATDKLEVSFIPVMYETLDYWLQYNESDKTWRNIGNKITLSGPVQSNQILIAVPKVGSGGNYSVNLSSVPSNSCTLTGAGLYNGGDDVIITVNPNDGYVFVRWEELINDTWVVLSNEPVYVIKEIGRDRTIRAYLEKATPTNTAKLTLISDGNGTVVGSFLYYIGMKATARAIPNKGYIFAYWEDEKGKSVSTDAVYSFKIYKNTTLKAIFKENPYNEDLPVEVESDVINNSLDSGYMKYGDTDMLTIFTPTPEQVKIFAESCFGQDNFLNWLQSVGMDLMGFQDFIINFYVLPTTIGPAGTKYVKCAWFPTFVSMDYANKNYWEISCGKLHIDRMWNNALDYNTSITIYLPFIGEQVLNTDEVLDKDIEVIYRIDLVTGDCICQLLINGSCLYQFTGSCAYSIPVTKASYSDALTKVSNGAIGLLAAGSGIAEGMTKAVELAGKKERLSTITTKRGNAKKGFGAEKKQLVSDIKDLEEPVEFGYDNLNIALGNIATLAYGGAKRIGSVGGSLGHLSISKPYIIYKRPNLSMPDNYGKFNGFPCNKFLPFKSLIGYTEVSAVHLEGIPCTADELEMINKSLHNGVIF